MALDDLVPPVATVDGRPVSPSFVRAEERPGQVPTITIETTTVDPIEPGASLDVVLPGGSPGALEFGEVNDQDTPAGVLCLAIARPPAARLVEEAISVCIREMPRTALLQELLSGAGLSARDIGGSDQLHARLTLLSEPNGPVIGRLGLLGGCLVLYSAAGEIFVNPAEPGHAIPLPVGGTTFRRRRRTVPALTLVAPDPVEWGKVIRYQTSAGSIARRRVLRLPEAVADDELAAAAAAIQAIERAGRFEVSGGLALAGIAPGSWISTGRRPGPFLVTGRIREWNPVTGWQFTLMGGYPWDHLGAPQTADSEPCEVVAYDEKTGLLKVRLPAHDDVVIDAGIRADRASAKELDTGLPAVGDRGTVLFGAGCDQVLYIGATIPPGRLSKEQFDQIVNVIQTAKLARFYRKDGGREASASRPNRPIGASGMSLPRASISTSVTESDRPRLAFPLALDADGRLLCVHTEPAAVRQLLSLVRDLARGEYPGLPAMHNPCDLARGETAEEQIGDLCHRLESFFDSIGLTGLRAAWQRPSGRGAPRLGRIVIWRDERWSLSLPLERREGMIVWDANSSEQGGH